jgi:hypothetical protein
LQKANVAQLAKAFVDVVSEEFKQPYSAPIKHPNPNNAQCFPLAIPPDSACLFTSYSLGFDNEA